MGSMWYGHQSYQFQGNPNFMAIPPPKKGPSRDPKYGMKMASLELLKDPPQKKQHIHDSLNIP